MKKKILAILLALVGTFSYAQSPQSVTRTLLQYYDLAALAASPLACAPNQISINPRITTSGSSTTTTALTANQLPFTLAEVGDLIEAQAVSSAAGVATRDRAIRVITAKASGDSVTVNSAWTLPTAGVSYRLIKPNCSTITNATPWIEVSQNTNTTLNFNITANTATGGISFRVEGLFSDYSDVNPIVTNLWPGVVAADAKCPYGTFDATANCNYSSTTGGITFSTTDVFRPKAIRLVMFIVTADAGVNAVNLSITESK